MDRFCDISFRAFVITWALAAIVFVVLCFVFYREGGLMTESSGGAQCAGNEGGEDLNQRHVLAGYITLGEHRQLKAKLTARGQTITAWLREQVQRELIEIKINDSGAANSEGKL